MMLLGFIIAAVALAIGSYCDIRTREIPDFLNFMLVAAGFVMAIFYSFYYWSLSYVFYSLAGYAFAWIISAILYYSGQWGGGDFKIFLGIGAIIGFNYNVVFSSVPDIVVFLFNLFLIGAVFGLIWVVYLSIRNWKIFSKEFHVLRTKSSNKRLRWIFLSGFVVLFVVLFLIKLRPDIKILIFSVLFLAYLGYYLSMFIRSVEKVCMTKEILVSSLTEGDWIVSELKLKNGKKLKSGKTGVSSEEIELLKKSGIKRVIVKEGMPFVPSFLIALILLQFLGNWLSFI